MKDFTTAAGEQSTLGVVGSSAPIQDLPARGKAVFTLAERFAPPFKNDLAARKKRPIPFFCLTCCDKKVQLSTVNNCKNVSPGRHFFLGMRRNGSICLPRRNSCRAFLFQIGKLLHPRRNATLTPVHTDPSHHTLENATSTERYSSI